MLTVIAFNVLYILLALAAFAAIGGLDNARAFWLFHLAQLLMHLEIACVCFALSALMRKPGAGLGLGLSALLYVAGLMSNISQKAEFLKYFTPYAYADAARVIPDGRIDPLLAGIGLALTIAAAAFGVIYYSKKDIHA